MEMEIACEKVTTEIMNDLADLFGEQDVVLYDKIRHKIIYPKALMLYGVGFNRGRKIISRRRRVSQLTLTDRPIKIWDYICDAEKALNISRGKITMCARGQRNSAGGYVWKYIDE